MSYTVVAPKRVRPHSDFHVVATTQRVELPTTFYFEVSGQEDSGQNRSCLKSVVVEPNSTNIAKLEIGDMGFGSYKLTVRAEGGLNISDATELEYDQKSCSVFIMTDKAFYKPGQTMRLRVLLLDRYLRPVNHSVDVHVSDGKQNRVKQWLAAPLRQGVFSAALPLSDSVVLGAWTITASALGQTATKAVDVEEYVLPTFSVSTEVIGIPTLKEHKLLVSVHAQYTYGKPVRGEATITVSPAAVPFGVQHATNSIKKTAPIIGKTIVEVDFEALKLSQEFDQRVDVEVSFEETFTQQKQSASTRATIRRDAHTVEVISKSGSNPEPGETFLISVRVADLHGAPVRDDLTPVTLRYGFGYVLAFPLSDQRFIQEDGVVEFELAVPASATQLTCQAEYKDVCSSSAFICRPQAPVEGPSPYTVPLDSSTNASVLGHSTVAQDWPSSSLEPMRIKLTNGKLKVDDDIELEVTAALPLRHVSYVVVTRGDIVEAKTVAMSEANKSTAKIRIPVTPTMAPSSKVLVYSVEEGGELLAASVKVHVDVNALLQNYVNLTTRTHSVEPGRDVELHVESRPNSIVGLLGVDESVLIKKANNNISTSDVKNEVIQYEGSSQPTHFGFRRQMGCLPRLFSGDASFAFENAGTVFVTNGKIKPVPPQPTGMAHTTSLFGSGIHGFCRTEGTVYRQAPQKDAPRIRKNFPETWIWDTIDSGLDGKVTLTRTAPDTITSWAVTGFSLDPVHGLGLTSQPTKVKVFKDFFISLALPYSVVRGELLEVPVTVFNYTAKEATAEVIMDRSNDFEIVEDFKKHSKLESQIARKRVTVDKQTSGTVTFFIKSRNLGYVSIKVSAIGDKASDALERALLVKPEGSPHYKNNAFFVNLENKGASGFRRRISLEIPPHIVQGSEKIDVSAIGDILGPTTDNLHKLIRMPYGCGEQNMLNFVPNIVILDYLAMTGKGGERVQRDARMYMDAGYQRELTYRHDDGSFSAFGKYDQQGSTWLTAFVVKSFLQAKTYIAVEDRIIDEALHWLAGQQAANGSFPEVGKVFHSNMQGGAANGLALTAYVLTTFLHDQMLTTKYQDVVNKGLENIVKHLDELDDSYAIVISTYALHLAKHPAKEQAFKLLECKANLKGDSKWWSKTQEQNNPWYGEPNSLDVEMTSYALLTYLERLLVAEALPVMSWLISQRNENGGFASTQDTVIGLQALAALAAKIYSRPGDLTVTFTYPAEGDETTTFNINRSESMVLHRREIPRSIRDMVISAEGDGFAVVQVSYSYNEETAGEYPLFTLTPQVNHVSSAEHIHLSVRTAFIPGSYGLESNMAVMEVVLPSGFCVVHEALSALVGSEGVSRDSVAVLYFDKITEKELNPSIYGLRTHKVAMLKPASVIVYDYYDQSRRARSFYELHADTTMSDVFEEDGSKQKIFHSSATAATVR